MGYQDYNKYGWQQNMYGRDNRRDKKGGKNDKSATEEIKELLLCIDDIKKLRGLLEVSDNKIRMENIVRVVCGNTTQNQIRKFYDQIKEIERKLSYDKTGDYENIKLQLSLLIPKLVYSGKKGGGKLNSNLVDFMKQAISKINNANNEDFKKQFENFVSLLESMIAFMKNK